MNPSSYANVLNPECLKHKANFRSLDALDSIDDVDLAIPLTLVEEVNNRLANSLNG